MHPELLGFPLKVLPRSYFMPSRKLSQSIVDKLQGTGSEVIYFDRELAGFGVRIAPKGTKSYIIQKRISGRERKHTIGRANILKFAEAKNKARVLIGEISSGSDPFSIEAKAVTDFDTLFERYLVDHAEKLKKRRSCLEDRRLIQNHLLPRLRAISPEKLSRQNVIDLKLDVAGELPKTSKSATNIQRGKADLKGGKITANRCLSLLSKVFNFGADNGLIARTDNPVKRIPKYPEKRREDYLGMDELASLRAALRRSKKYKLELRSAIDAIEVLMLTGARLNEIRLLKWTEVDFEKCELKKPDTKTGPREIFICPRTKNILLRRHRSAKKHDEYVFAGIKKSSPVSLAKPWMRVRSLAKLDPKYSLHTLRHTFATQAALHGVSAHQIQKLLVVCLPESGPLFELVPASDMELRHGQEINA
ncbi:MAG: site-specific integrase [Hyphomonas sp.]